MFEQKLILNKALYQQSVLRSPYLVLSDSWEWQAGRMFPQSTLSRFVPWNHPQSSFASLSVTCSPVRHRNHRLFVRYWVTGSWNGSYNKSSITWSSFGVQFLHRTECSFSSTPATCTQSPPLLAPPRRLLWITADSWELVVHLLLAVNHVKVRCRSEFQNLDQKTNLAACDSENQIFYNQANSTF